MVTKGDGGDREINQEFRINVYILLYIEQITNKDLPCSTGNYIQYFVINHNGKESEKGMYIYILAYWRRQWQPTPVLLPGKSHGWRSLVGCNTWSCEESDTTEQIGRAHV